MNRVCRSWGKVLLNAAVLAALAMGNSLASAQQMGGNQWSPRRPTSQGSAHFSTPSQAPRRDPAVVQAGGFKPTWQETPRVVSRPVQSAAYYQQPTPAPEVLPTPHPADDIFGSQPNFMPEGEVYHEGPVQDGFYDPMFGPEMGGPATGCGEACGGVCGTPGCGGPDCWLCIPLCGPCGILGFIHESSIFGGVHGFKGPLDQGRNGNFGFQEGVNIAGCGLDYFGIGYQLGANFVQSNLSGDVSNGTYRSANRDQVFLTAGLFHRAWDHWGWQWGVAYDYLDDNYYTNNQVGQMRVEVSYLFKCGHEIGFWGAYGVRNDEDTDSPDAAFTVETTDIWAVFYRRNLCNGGQGRIWAGGTDRQDGILGADFRIPLSNRFDMIGGFNYLAPQEGSNNNGHQEESWGLTMQLVWYFGRCRDGIHNTQYRPLFNVADNNVMMLERLMR